MRRFLRYTIAALALTSFSANAAVIGDVNGDGAINISDVNVLINMILTDDQASNGDVNGDGAVNISDVNDVINRILGDIIEIQSDRLVGGDISMLTTFEDHQRTARARGISYAYYRDINNQRINDLIPWLVEQGWNAARVRLFVNPENASQTRHREGVLQNLDSVKVLGHRIKAAGMKFMLDFHYSDTWADPANQFTPAAWVDMSDDELEQQVYDYTCDCLHQLKEADAEPDYIQTGNEISYGMLWGPEGASGSQLKQCFSNSPEANWARFARMLIAAGRACRDECPDAKIILHTERVPNVNNLVAFYNKMNTRGVDYDIIGLSYYAYYHGLLSQLNTALRALETSFPSRDIMIVETGYSYRYPMAGSKEEYCAWPLTYEGQRQFTKDLIETLHQHDNVKGLFWWYPEANEYGLGSNQVNEDWYNANLWDHSNGKALPALYELKNFVK